MEAFASRQLRLPFSHNQRFTIVERDELNQSTPGTFLRQYPLVSIPNTPELCVSATTPIPCALSLSNEIAGGLIKDHLSSHSMNLY